MVVAQTTYAQKMVAAQPPYTMKKAVAFTIGETIPKRFCNFDPVSETSSGE